MNVCEHKSLDGLCTVGGCKHNPERTLDELLEFYQGPFVKGATISVPYGATHRALSELRERRAKSAGNESHDLFVESQRVESSTLVTVKCPSCAREGSGGGALVSNEDVKRWTTLEANVRNILDEMGAFCGVHAVRVREGGGPEDLAMSLAVSVVKLENEVERLKKLINSPHINDFSEAVKLEAAHQRERWGVDHDAGKTDAEWFWLIGYLAGKALHAAGMPPDAVVTTDDRPATQINSKQLHHIITTAAACLNWHANKMGVDTRMRPGIDSPKDDE